MSSNQKSADQERQEETTKGFLENYFRASVHGVYDRILELQYQDGGALELDYTQITNKAAKDMIDARPGEFIKLAKVALSELDTPIEFDYSATPIRITGYPHQTQISRLRSKHLTKFVCIEGTVRELSEVRPTYVRTAFRCLRCGHVTMVDQPDGEWHFKEPFAGCENETCGKRGPFVKDDSLSTTKDQQRIVIQENLDGLNGAQPSSIMIELDNELSGNVKAGEKITVSGPLQSYQKSNREGKTKHLEIYVHAIDLKKNSDSFESLNITSENIEEFKLFSQKPDLVDTLVNSYAPHIYGYEEEKLAILLMCFGGVRKEFPDGAKTRGDLNILLVGDPGLAKTQLLKYVKNFVARCIITSGKSTTSAGLTASAEKSDLQDGKWTLKAGAMVLANGDTFPGVVCVDEMDKMSTEHLSGLHDAMESQELHIAKASIVQELNVRCSVLGAANPKNNRFDPSEPIADQIGFPGSLLTRFDLIFSRQDKPDKVMDSAIARHILAYNLLGERLKHGEQVQIQESDTLNPEFIRGYIAYSKTNIFPVMSEEVMELFFKEYLDIRMIYGGNKDKPIPITARALETYIRLSEAAARMRLSETIEAQDALIAIRLMKFCQVNNGIDTETGLWDVDRLESGNTHSQRNKIKIIKVFIEEQGTATLDEIKKECKFKGVDGILSKLITRGELFQPEKDVYRVVK